MRLSQMCVQCAHVVLASVAQKRFGAAGCRISLLQQERGRIRASGVVMLLRLLTTERSPVP